MRTLIALVCAAAMAAADTPAPSPRDTDAVTRRRADEALAAHATATAKPSAPADLALLDRITGVDTVVKEGEAFLAKQLAVEAGERYLTAAELIKTFTPDERTTLSARWSALQTAYTALGRTLAESTGLEQAAAAAAIPEPAATPAP